MTRDPNGRLDAWLWHARFFKTRADAAAFVADGRVRIARGGTVRRTDKPGCPVNPGDTLTFARNGRLVSVTILALAARRGSPEDAAALYQTAAGDAG
jgi:ribosome-associated heat shock protein Hsp15